MPSSRTLFRPLLFLCLPLLWSGSAFAQQPDETKKDLELEALGGISLEVPGWKEVRRDSAVAVFEQAPEPAANKPYYVLMCAFEEGPPADAPIAWDKVRDNIVQAASKNGRKLTLELKEPYTGAGSFEGRRFIGEFTSATPNRMVAIELLALVKDAKLLTIGLIAEALGPETNKLVQGVAKTAKLP
jgi:hypothetical protein